MAPFSKDRLLRRLKVPFATRTLLGITIGDDEVICTELVCFGTTLTHARIQREFIDDHDVEGALKRLADTVKPTHAYVAGALDPQHVRYQLAEGPVFDEWSSFAAWLEAEASHLLPLGARLDDFETRYRILEATEIGTWCLIALVHREAAHARHTLLVEAGFAPVLLGCLDAEAAALLAVEAESPQVITLSVHPTHAALGVSQQGSLKKLIALASGTDDLEALCAEVQSYLLSLDSIPTSAPVVVAGHQAAAVVQCLRRNAGKTFPIRESTLSLAVSDASLTVPPDALPSAALALGLLHGTDPSLNFLPPSETQARKQHLERADAMRLLVMVGGMLFLCVLFLFGTGNYIASKKAASDAALRTVSGQIAEIEAAQENLAQWKRDVAQAERLVVERTHAAAVLTVVGRVAPEGVWLSGITLENTDNAPGTHRLTLQGAAVDEPSMATYLDRLEQASFIRNVRLLYSERIAANRLLMQAAQGSRPVIRFEMQFDALPVDLSSFGVSSADSAHHSNPVP